MSDETSRDFQTVTAVELWLAAICGVYGATAVLLDERLYALNFLQYAPIFLLAAPVFALCGLAGAGVLRRPGAPVSFIRDKLRERWIAALCITLACWAGMAAFWTYKFHIPHLVPFYADRLLADLDDAIHFGAPWRTLHHVLPAAATPILLIIYFPLWIAQFIGGVVCAAFHGNRRLRSRYLASFAMVIAGLGNVLAAGVSSVGPIFYQRILGDGRFAELTDILNTEPYAFIAHLSQRLYSSFVTGSEGIVAGISAMPSIHVAIPTLNALLLSTIDRRLGYVAWMFTGLILIGSVYFGWHYAVDGYVSLVAVCIIWRLAGRLAAVGSRRAERTLSLSTDRIIQPSCTPAE